MLPNVLISDKIGHVVEILSKRLNISLEDAFDIFYTSRTCDMIHNPKAKLYLHGDEYIADEVMLELAAQVPIVAEDVEATYGTPKADKPE